jgi:hypothetical protein
MARVEFARQTSIGTMRSLTGWECRFWLRMFEQIQNHMRGTDDRTDSAEEKRLRIFFLRGYLC